MSEKLPYSSYFPLKTGIRNSWFLRNLVIPCFFLAAFFIVPTVIGSNGTREGNAEALVPAGEEQLLMFFEPGQITVTSSARRPQPIARATSAMYVLTAEDIHQAGAVHLADLLRLVPGMEVSHKRGYSFAVSARGFAKPANVRMQVLLDGRPMYDPAKGGVDFAFQPIFLENIERIEVIRGSGGVTWGVNAMNGVINIITKKASDTQGGLGYGGFGNRALQQGFIRLGGTDEQLSCRATVGVFNDRGFGSDHGKSDKGTPTAPEDWMRAFQATGRADLKLSDDAELSFAGGHRLTSVSRPGDRRHAMEYMNLLLRKTLADDSSLQVRLSENIYSRRARNFDLQTQSAMLEIQHNFVSGVHNVVWGADYARDTYFGYPTTTLTDAYDPDSFTDDRVSAFIEDEIALAKDLWLTIGTRQYHNELTDYDWAGRTALVWEAAPKHFIRAAVSKSFRRPIMSNKFFHTVRTDNGNVWKLGNDAIGNEQLVSYEIGYRGQIRKNLELNIEGFLNKHKNLIGRRRLTAAEHADEPWSYFNVYNITTYGIETAIDFRPYDWWLVRAFHAYEHQTDEKELNRGSSEHSLDVYTVPQHKVGLTNRFYIDDSTTINTQMFWSDALFANGDKPIDPYFRFDIRLAKKIWNDSAELAFGVTNLTEHFHYEGDANMNEVPRQIYMQFFYKF